MKTIREMRHLAHLALDQLWKGDSPIMSRDGAYKWASWALGIPRAECHISMFDWSKCQRLIYAVEDYFGITPENRQC